jgi:glycine oxidase
MHDFLLVGNGLAGAILAYQLIKAGKSIAIVDDQDERAAYKAAGGVWNAITFRKILKGWNADALTETSDAFYRNMEKETGLAFYSPKEVVKLFPDVAFQNNWLAKTEDPAFDGYLSESSEIDWGGIPVHAPFGYGVVHKGGYVDLDLFMPAIHRFIREKAKSKGDSFYHKELTLHVNWIDYKGIKAKAIIFAEGHRIQKNPFFDWIPMAPVKGEIITVKNPGWNFDFILNNGKHLLDKKEGTLSVGSTFEWKDLSLEPTRKARESLIDHLAKNIRYKGWEVREHKVGIRPAVSDRRPVIGTHPVHKNVHVFNGLGTKGVMIAPWLSQVMRDYLLKDSTIDPDIDLKRFLRKHFKSSLLSGKIT